MPWCCLGRRQQIFNPHESILREVLRVNGCCTLASTVLAALSSLLCPCAALHDDHTKQELVESLSTWGLPHAVGTRGSAGMRNASCSNLMDSGLLIVSSVAPVKSGFIPYSATGVEGAAHKGWLWALLPPVDTDKVEGKAHGDGRAGGGGQLIITTHQHADQPNFATPGAVRAEQRAELLAGLHQLRAELAPSVVVVCGDLNEEAHERADGAGLCADFRAAGLVRLTACSRAAGTCIKDDGSGRVQELDHIYAAGPGVARLAYEPQLPLRTPHSDHSLLWVTGIRMPVGDTESQGADTVTELV